VPPGIRREFTRHIERGTETRAVDFALARPFAAGWEPEHLHWQSLGAHARHYAGIKPTIPDFVL